MTKNSYWDHTGKFQEDYDRLYSQLVPLSGKCETLEGELLRSVSKIYHDYYNNGFGNNWSGPLEYLKEFGPITAKNYEVLKPYSRGRIYRDSEFFESDVAQALEETVDSVIQSILERSNQFRENQTDMFDFQLSTVYEEDDEDELDYSEFDYDAENEENEE